MDSDSDNGRTTDYHHFNENFSAPLDNIEGIGEDYDVVDEHRYREQLTEAQQPSDTRQPSDVFYTVPTVNSNSHRPQDSGADERYLVIPNYDDPQNLPEEPVKSKPLSCRSKKHRQQSSETDTDDSEGSDDGVGKAVSSTRAHTKNHSNSDASEAYGGDDDDTEPETEVGKLCRTSYLLLQGIASYKL